MNALERFISSLHSSHTTEFSGLCTGLVSGAWHDGTIRTSSAQMTFANLPPEAADWNLFISVSAFLFFLSNFIMVANMVISYLRGARGSSRSMGRMVIRVDDCFATADALIRSL